MVVSGHVVEEEEEVLLYENVGLLLGEVVGMTRVSEWYFPVIVKERLEDSFHLGFKAKSLPCSSCPLRGGSFQSLMFLATLALIEIFSSFGCIP